MKKSNPLCNVALASAGLIVAASAGAEERSASLIPKPYTDGKAALEARQAATEFFVEDDVDVLLTLASEQPGDGFGWVAESLGDINGDGADDFIVTAPFFVTNLPFSAGKVYVYSGADGSLLNSVTSPGVALLGYSAKAAGDVDADGVTDYIVGSFSSAMVFSGATHAILHIWYANNEFFGASVTGAGDLDADGYDDLIVGATYAGARNPNAGRIYAYSGFSGRLLWRREGRREGDELGTATGFVGDVDLDGVPDVVAGARGAGRREEGRAYVLSGRSGAILRTLRPLGRPGIVTDGAGVAAGTFGQFHAFGVGDVDGDSVPDVYVGDYNARQIETDGTGRGYLYSGASGDRLHVFQAENPGDGLGPARGVGDVNADGAADLFIAAYTFTGGSNAGKGYLYSGADFSVLRTLTGEVPSQLLGVDALGAGDVNGDGLADLMLTGNGVLHIVAGQPAPERRAPNSDDAD